MAAVRQGMGTQGMHIPAEAWASVEEQEQQEVPVG